MKYGFIKAAAATPHIHVADVVGNAKAIQENIAQAKKVGAELLVFPELCLSGYSCGDLFMQDSLLQAALESLHEIVQSTINDDILIFVGLPYRKSGYIYDCAAVINHGKLLALVPKRYSSVQGQYEGRAFRLYNGENCMINFYGQSVLFGNKIVFQEETQQDFTVSAELHEDAYACISPAMFHVFAGANVIVNLSAEHEIVGKTEYRHTIIESFSQKTASGYIYTGASIGESSTDFVFSDECFICECGRTIAVKKSLTDSEMLVTELDIEKIASERQKAQKENNIRCEGYQTVLFSANSQADTLTRCIPQSAFVPENAEKLFERSEYILKVQSEALKRRLSHIHAKSAVIGISGGLDSTLALLSTVRAFDSLNKERKDIIAVTMPCFGTTQKTKSNAVRLAELLGVTVRVIPVEKSVRMHFSDIGHAESIHNAAYENSQARMRTMVLMNLANDVGGIVVGTGDLSELALGWATYNGDHMSMYGVNADIPKTLMKYLTLHEAERLGGELKTVLTDIVNTEISPELLPAQDGKISQKTEELVGPYELHDFYLYYVIRFGFSPKKIYFLAKNAFADKYSDEVLKKWLKQFYKRFFTQQFKRSCQPDGVAVGSVSLSPRGSWNMPSDAISELWQAEVDKL